MQDSGEEKEFDLVALLRESQNGQHTVSKMESGKRDVYRAGYCLLVHIKEVDFYSKK